MTSGDALQSLAPEDPLLRRFLKGDAAVYRQAETWVRQIIRYKYFGIPNDEHDDLVQQTLVDVWRAAVKHSFLLRHGLRAFVRHVATRRCIDWFRHRRLTQDADDSLVDSGPEPGREIADLDERTRVHEAIRRLDPACREIIRLHYFEELSYAEIAARLDRAEATMRVRMFNCMKLVRKFVEASA